MQVANAQTQVRTEGDQVLVDVAWKRADDVQAHLQRQGIESVLCADAAQQKAYLELRPGADRQAVSRVLEEMGAG